MRQRDSSVALVGPGIRLRARRFELKLKRVLMLAASSGAGPRRDLVRLCRSARVVGLSPQSPRTAVIEITAAPFEGGLYEMYPWSVLQTTSEADLAEALAFSLRSALSDVRRKI